MRDIKFRAWDKENKRWMTPEIEDEEESEIRLDLWGNIIFRLPWYKQTEGTRATVYGNDTFDIMQYTGLKDKNGVEIFEGDVLFHPLQGRRKVYYPYSETVASFGLQDIDNGFGSTLQDSHAVWEVIGNIWEGGDLLEVSE